MLTEYAIAKLSGEPGLLDLAKSILKSGLLGEEYDEFLQNDGNIELNNNLLYSVILNLKKLTQYLPDEGLRNSLCSAADNVLEKIELRTHTDEIF
ncbi:MAG: hypothetical protein GX677_03145 [Treponema sp.]|nr:hypothetical protein [Treponema sp.]